MHIFPVIIDSQPAYARTSGSQTGVLGLPCGTDLVLTRVCRMLAAVTFQRPTVFAPYGAATAYRDQLVNTSPYPIDWAPELRFSNWLTEREPSDLLLLVDPRTFPVEPVDLQQLVTELTDVRVGQFLVGIDGDSSQTEELALFDEHGNIRRIQRYYGNVTRLRTRGVFAALIAATSCRVGGQPTVESLVRIRTDLAAAGVPHRDITLEHPLLDLHQPRALLDLNERALRDLPPVVDGYRHLSDGVLVAQNAHVDASASIMGPIVIQPGAHVERNTLLIGPTVVGTGAVVRNDAEVIQSVVTPGAAIVPLRSVRHQVAFSTEQAVDPGGDYDSLAEAAAYAQYGLEDEGSETDPRSRNQHGFYPWAKRATDVLVSGLGLLALLPVIIVICVLIKLTSRGPILFAHQREGLGGKPFECFKFRTMVQDAHERQRELYEQSDVDGPQFKIPDDPRVTTIGRYLRDWCIDEIPQLWNVLVGQMSLVGPRPSPFRENQICIPWRNARLSVRPGITGLWQICRSARSLGDFHQWIHFDILYVRNAGYWLDLKIMVWTFLSLGGRRDVPVHWMIPRHKVSVWDPLARDSAARGAEDDSDTNLETGAA